MSNIGRSDPDSGGDNWGRSSVQSDWDAINREIDDVVRNSLDDTGRSSIASPAVNMPGDQGNIYGRTVAPDPMRSVNMPGDQGGVYGREDFGPETPQLNYPMMAVNMPAPPPQTPTSPEYPTAVNLPQAPISPFASYVNNLLGFDLLGGPWGTMPPGAMIGGQISNLSQNPFGAVSSPLTGNQQGGNQGAMIQPSAPQQGFQINPMQVQNDMGPWGQTYPTPQMNPINYRSMGQDQTPFSWNNYLNTFGGK